MSFKLKLNTWLKSQPVIAEARRRVDDAFKEHKERMRKINEEEAKKR